MHGLIMQGFWKKMWPINVHLCITAPGHCHQFWQPSVTFFFSLLLPPWQGCNSFYTNRLLVFLLICLPYWFITTYVAFHVLDINKACLIKPVENPRGPSEVSWTLMWTFIFYINNFLTDVGFVFLAIHLKPFYTVVILLQEQWSW